MPPNFFSKLVKNTPASQTSSTLSTTNERTSSPPSSRPHSQSMSHLSSHPFHYGDAAKSASTGSVKIGVIPPSPQLSDPDLPVQVAYKPNTGQIKQHRRIRSQERQILDRHGASLAARPASDISHHIDETEPRSSPKSVNEKPSKRSMRGTTLPPLNLDHNFAEPRNAIDIPQAGAQHQDTPVLAPNTLVESPPPFVPQKLQSQELLGAPSDVDVTGSSARTQSPHVSLSKSDFSDGDYPSSGDESGSSSDELDLNEQDIPVTGFAVASNKRNADFHELFPNIPEGDYLIEDYGCALQREILIQGRLYISENHICFHANIFGWITDLSIPIYEITGLEKRTTAFVIPNAIQITTRQAKYTFASFLSRDTTFDVIANIWRLARPDGVPCLADSHVSARDTASLATSVSGSAKESPTAGANKVTHCACSKSGGHLSEVALETVLPGTPDKIYNLMFASGFIKDFMKVDQKLGDIQISDWAPIGQTSKLLQRNMSYIKPLNNSVGPRQTKCETRDETMHCDFDDYVVMLTTTRTPDVPSGGVFVVKTQTCLMWASSITTRVIVTSQLEWSGRSFIKGLIEKSALEGQRAYHSDLDKAMRMYIQEHQAEFIPEGLDPTVVAPVEPITPLAEGNGVHEILSAQEAREARERDRNRRGMQWAYDTLEGAYRVGERSAKGALELVKEAWEQSSSTTILWFVIVSLVLSNVWTLMLVGRREEVGRRKEMKRAEEKERWLQGVVAGVWEELAAERARSGSGVSVPLPSVPVGDVQTEVGNIGKVLDSVEQRVRTIRESLDGLS